MRLDSPIVLGFISGFFAAGFLVATLFFLKFWRTTGDRLFAAFAAAFALLGIAAPLPVFTGLVGASADVQAPIYLVRLAAFGLILAAIVDKNLRRS